MHLRILFVKGLDPKVLQVSAEMLPGTFPCFLDTSTSYLYAKRKPPSAMQRATCIGRSRVLIGILDDHRRLRAQQITDRQGAGVVGLLAGFVETHARIEHRLFFGHAGLD